MADPFRSRKVARICPAFQAEEGAGFLVHQALPLQNLPQIDPFLLIHELGPKELLPGEAKGAPDHPHRGFETVTYFLNGEFEHRDSAGHHGVLRPGDAQWMTAGRGVVHSEMPTERFVRSGGLLHGFQIWVNLPKRLKMSEPRYQDTPAARLPVVEIPGMDSRVKVIAGEFHGQRSPIQPSVPVLLLDIELSSGAEIFHRLPEGWSALAYVYANSGRLGDEAAIVAERHMAVFDDSGDGVRIMNARVSPILRLLLLAGEKIGEPIARYGPFVMNTEDEIRQAFIDFS